MASGADPGRASDVIDTAHATPAQTAPPPARHLRRRGVLLAGLVAGLSLVVIAGAWQLWPLFALPIVVSLPLAGLSGFGATLMASALVFALASAHGPSGAELAIAFAGFAAASWAAWFVWGRREGAAPAWTAVGDVHDATRLLTEQELREAVTRACRRSDRRGGAVALVAFGLEEVRPFERRNGLGAADRLLLAIESELVAAADGHGIPVRLGPGEVGVLVEGSVRDADRLASEIGEMLEAVRVPVPGGRVEGIRVSAGVAGHAPGAGGAADLLADARTALAAERARISARERDPGGAALWDTGRLPRVSAA